jgi:hypothetical protein
MGVEVGRLAKEGRLLWKAPLPKTDAEKTANGDKVVFAPDGVHPHVETGHALYMEAIARSLPAIQSSGQEPSAHTLGAPFIASNFERAKLVPINEATLSGGIIRLDPASDAMAKRFPQLRALHRGTKPGESITFRFKGTRAALYDLVGPDCGQVVVTLDNMPPKTIPRFDAYCTYHRLSTFTIGSDLPDTEHTVKIEIHPDQPDKAKILAQRNEKFDKPERFDGTAIYPGAILMLGELVK